MEVGGDLVSLYRCLFPFHNNSWGYKTNLFIYPFVWCPCVCLLEISNFLGLIRWQDLKMRGFDTRRAASCLMCKGMSMHRCFLSLLLMPLNSSRRTWICLKPYPVYKNVKKLWNTVWGPLEQHNWYCIMQLAYHTAITLYWWITEKTKQKLPNLAISLLFLLWDNKLISKSRKLDKMIPWKSMIFSLPYP